MNDQKPSVGRIVHVKDPNSPLCHIAFVVYAYDTGEVNLLVFNELGEKQPMRIKSKGWHWPERV